MRHGSSATWTAAGKPGRCCRRTATAVALNSIRPADVTITPVQGSHPLVPGDRFWLGDPRRQAEGDAGSLDGHWVSAGTAGWSWHMAVERTAVQHGVDHCGGRPGPCRSASCGSPPYRFQKRLSVQDVAV